MNPRNFILLIILLVVSCSADKTRKPFSISKLYIGLSNAEAFIQDKGDSARYLPPPPFTEEIANNTILEARSGKVYFYSFPKKAPLCGYMMENEKNNFELYKSDLDSLKPADLILVDDNNIESVIKQITKSSKPTFVVIGLQSDSSANEILTKLTTSLYRNSKNNVWKIRHINKKESEVLGEI